MRAAVRHFLVPIVLVLALCLTTTDTAQANVGYASDGKAAGVIVAVVAVGVLIGFGVYFAVHHGHSLRGCAAASSGGGMELLNEGDHEPYLLTGDAGGVRAGHRVRVSGNRSGRNFAVKHLAKDYGACPAQP